MRSLSAVVFALLLSLPFAQAAQQFPYTAYVNAQGVAARSGPGTDFYPTERLTEGEAVEVYRHAPEGWCAIRPLAQSSSWVAAEDVHVQDRQSGVVRRDGVSSRVGTKFRAEQNVVQVRLKRGEVVEILGAKTIDGRRWLKIAPPAGEFRFVKSEVLDARPAAVVSSRESEVEDNVDDYDVPSTDRRFEEEQPSEHARAVSRRTASRESIRLTGAIDRKENDIEEPAFTTPAETTLAGAPRSTSLELADIDLELSAIAAEDVSSWSLTAVRTRAQRALNDAQSALDRGRVRTVLTKIERFEEIKRRYDQQSAPKSTGEVRLPLAAGDAARTNVASATFDGVGRLAPVASRKAGAPKYALLSSTGEIMSYVTPAPGVDLRPFLSQQVGISGPSTYVPEARRQLISAQRVLPLEQAQLPVLRR